VRPPRKVKRKHGYVWEIRYRAEGRHKGRVFDRKSDAEDFQAEVRRRKRLGTLAQLHAGDELLADFAVEWWRVHAKPNLAPSTLHRYSQVWDSHVLPRLGTYRLKEITPEVVANLRADMTEAGVGDATTRKALFLLQGVLGLAVVRGAIAINPVKAVKKPRQVSRPVRPVAPEAVEAIRRRLRLRDATLVSVLAYAGLRPGEALALHWEHVRERTLLIESSISLGREKPTKTNATRTVRLLAPLAQDLAEWRLACGRPDGRAFIFPRRDGRPWSDDDYRNWRDRIFRPAAAGAGVDKPRPYDLRHSFVSLLIHEGVSIVEVARQAGHSPEECLRTYAHTFEEFDPAERTSAEAAIAAARKTEADPDVRVLYARAPEVDSAQLRFGFVEPSRRRDSNPRPPLYESGALAN
jgi:integrase